MLVTDHGEREFPECFKVGTRKPFIRTIEMVGQSRGLRCAECEPKDASVKSKNVMRSNRLSQTLDLIGNSKVAV